MILRMSRWMPLWAVVCLVAIAQGAEEGKPLLDVTDAGAVQAQVEENGSKGEARFQATDKGMEVTIDGGGKAGYPGVMIKPAEGATWDLSNFGNVQVRVTNTGEKRISVTARVDNAGQGETFNAEGKGIAPGKTETIKVIFGYGYGFNPSFALDPAKVNGVLLFTRKSPDPVRFVVESVTAEGAAGEKPPVNPDHVRIVPRDGVILGPGVDAAKDMKVATPGGKNQVVNGAVKVTFDAKSQRSAEFRPPMGRWNLRDYLQTKVVVKNTGDAPVTPRARVQSNGGATDWAVAEKPVAPGESVTLTVDFRPEKIWNGPADPNKKGEKGTGGTTFASNVVSVIDVQAEPSDAARSLTVESIVAQMPPEKSLPDWVGKRPPVEGDWKMTFEDNFDGDSIDFHRWNIYTANFWDKASHFSKENVIVGDGVVRLRYTAKVGHHNDDPSEKTTKHATGYMGTYGKWTQRYGYFEARMKLPTAPGMWPAFWLMPDRGVAAGPQWKRADTGNGGMEFDIMEYLSRWGPNRFTSVFHWDGYGKNHKSAGTNIYFQPDPEGYVTSGLLWLPGLAVYYCQGQEIARWETPRMMNVQAYPIFTAVSGGWDNDPVDDSKLPTDFVIDYIRVWQRSDLASPEDGPKPNDGNPAAIIRQD